MIYFGLAEGGAHERVVDVGSHCFMAEEGGQEVTKLGGEADPGRVGVWRYRLGEEADCKIAASGTLGGS